MNSTAHNKSMEFTIAKVGKLNLRLMKKAVLWTAASVFSFYLLGGIGAIWWSCKNEPQMQAAIADIEPGFARSALELIF